MDDGRWYLANIIFLLGSLVREVPGSIVVFFNDNDWVFATNSNLISEWLAMTGFSVSYIELLLCLTLSGNGVEIVRGGDAWLLGSVRMHANCFFLESVCVSTKFEMRLKKQKYFAAFSILLGNFFCLHQKMLVIQLSYMEIV